MIPLLSAYSLLQRVNLKGKQEMKGYILLLFAMSMRPMPPILGGLLTLTKTRPTWQIGTERTSISQRGQTVGRVWRGRKAVGVNTGILRCRVKFLSSTSTIESGDNGAVAEPQPTAGLTKEPLPSKYEVSLGNLLVKDENQELRYCARTPAQTPSVSTAPSWLSSLHHFDPDAEMAERGGRLGCGILK